MKKFLLLLLLITAAAGLKDTYALSVNSVYPEDESGGAALETSITAVFSSTLSPGIQIPDAVEVYQLTDNLGDLISPTRITPSSSSITGATITLTTTLSAGSRYKVILKTTIKDTLNNYIPEEYIWHFRTIYAASEENTVTGSDNTTKAVIPANCLVADGRIEINTTPAVSAELATPAELLSARQSVITDADPFIYPIDSTMKEFVVYTGSTTLYGSGELNSNAEIYMPYTSSDGGRYVEGSSPKVLVDNLTLYYLDTSTKKWVKAGGINIDKTNSVISARVNRLSIFVLMGSMPVGLKNAYAFPVPFMPNSNSNHTGITFTNLTPNAKIEIFTATYKPVKEVYAGSLGLDVAWDCKNNNGETLASGVYIYRITQGGDSKTGKLMIIR